MGVRWRQVPTQPMSVPRCTCAQSTPRISLDGSKTVIRAWSGGASDGRSAGDGRWVVPGVVRAGCTGRVGIPGTNPARLQDQLIGIARAQPVPGPALSASTTALRAPAGPSAHRGSSHSILPSQANKGEIKASIY